MTPSPHRFGGRPPPPDNPVIQASQVLHNSNASLSCLITIFYWGVVWPTLPDEAKYSGWWDKIAGSIPITGVVKETSHRKWQAIDLYSYAVGSN